MQCVVSRGSGSGEIAPIHPIGEGGVRLPPWTPMPDPSAAQSIVARTDARVSPRASTVRSRPSAWRHHHGPSSTNADSARLPPGRPTYAGPLGAIRASVGRWASLVA